VFPEPGEYVLRVKNYSGAAPWHAKIDQFPGKLNVTSTGRKESWTMTCEDADGHVLQRKSVIVDRGKAVQQDFTCGRS